MPGSGLSSFTDEMEAQVKHIANTPIGWLELIGNNQGISRCYWLADDEAVVSNGGASADWKKEVDRQLAEYFSGERLSFSLPLISSSPFQSEVSEILRHIPYGQTVTETEISASFEDKSTAQASRIAILGNPLQILVPCHRVVSDNVSEQNAPTDYRKNWLLQHEGALHAQQLRLF